MHGKLERSYIFQFYIQVGHKLITSNPCPICRDEYLVIDYKVRYGKKC